jgi:hypothetical protein
MTDKERMTPEEYQDALIQAMGIVSRLTPTVDVEVGNPVRWAMAIQNAIYAERNRLSRKIDGLRIELKVARRERKEEGK